MKKCKCIIIKMLCKTCALSDAASENYFQPFVCFKQKYVPLHFISNRINNKKKHVKMVT